MKDDKGEGPDILKHVLVPTHILLSEEEKRKVLEEYRIKPYQLPYIRASDPVAKAIGAKKGDVIKIIRKSPTAGESVAYRYVVDY
ncbi:MAG: DNA-directed RNA polymerase subunit H [Candidatus Bathyarchaeia archaeon]